LATTREDFYNDISRCRLSALAYWLLVGIGLIALAKCSLTAWCSSNRR
jgi:hypothetical protein